MQLRFGADEAPTTVDLEPGDRAWVGRVQVPATFDPGVKPLRYWVEALAPSGTTIGGLGTSDEPMVVAPTGEHAGGGPPPDSDVEPPPDPDGHAPHRRDVRDTIRRNEEFFRQRSALTSQWWFWTGIAVVVAGGVLAVAIVATDEGQAARVPEFGVWPLP
jgi:hypothetical protein